MCMKSWFSKNWLFVAVSLVIVLAVAVFTRCYLYAALPGEMERLVEPVHSILEDIGSATDEINASLDEVKEEQAAIKNELDSLKSDLDSARSEIVDIQEEIAVLEAAPPTIIREVVQASTPAASKPSVPAKPESEAPGVSQSKPEAKSEAPAPASTRGYSSTAEAEILRLTNQMRKDAGLGELTVDAKLSALARERAVEITELYSHTRPNGTTVSDLGYGENLVYRRSVSSAFTSWVESPSHLKNIMLSGVKRIGIGAYKADDGMIYFTQVFAY